MKKDSENSETTFTRRTERYKWYAFLKRTVPAVLNLIVIVCIVIFILYTAPVIEGSEVLDNPLTNSQITMMMVWAVIFAYYFGMMRRMR